MKIKVWYLASDTQSNGTNCELFTTEEKLKIRLRSILKSHGVSLDDTADVYECWRSFEDDVRDPLDTFTFDSAELEYPLPSKTFNTLETARDALHDVQQFWHPKSTSAADIMRSGLDVQLEKIDKLLKQEQEAQ